MLAGKGPGPAAGSTAAVTVSLAAGLATKVAKAAADREAVAQDLAEELDRLRAKALSLADDDVEAFAGFLEAQRLDRLSGRGGVPAAAEAIVQVPADVVTVAVRVAELAALLAEEGPDALTGDAVTAAFLAAAAAESAAMLVGTNIADSQMVDGGELADPRVEQVEERAGHARTLAERLV